ncbi:g2938 [Coccomyxa elongata]
MGVIAPATEAILMAKSLRHTNCLPFHHNFNCIASRHKYSWRLVQARSNLFFGEDSYGGSQQKSEEVITFLTANGFVQFPSRTSWQVPHRELHLEALPTEQEQGLCVGATFRIAATNGADPKRRLHLLGFCRSVDSLSEVVEDAVLRRGGSVMLHNVETRSGVHEILKMTVAIPLLYGIPPEYEYLRSAISSGGGIVEKMSRQWHMY